MADVASVCPDTGHPFPVNGLSTLINNHQITLYETHREQYDQVVLIYCRYDPSDFDICDFYDDGKWGVERSCGGKPSSTCVINYTK